MKKKKNNPTSLISISILPATMEIVAGVKSDTKLSAKAQLCAQTGLRQRLTAERYARNSRAIKQNGPYESGVSDKRSIQNNELTFKGNIDRAAAYKIATSARPPFSIFHNYVRKNRATRGAHERFAIFHGRRSERRIPDAVRR